MLPYNKYLKQHSRELRNNLTDAERSLWSKLRRKQLNGVQFYRQRIIGDYIVDFYCHQAKIVVEVDGSQHYSQDMMERDRKRDEYMKSSGLMVLRFSDAEVLENIEGVVQRIWEHMSESNPP